MFFCDLRGLCYREPVALPRQDHVCGLWIEDENLGEAKISLFIEILIG